MPVDMTTGTVTAVPARELVAPGAGGLLGITVPRAYGGGLLNSTLPPNHGQI